MEYLKGLIFLYGPCLQPKCKIRHLKVAWKRLALCKNHLGVALVRLWKRERFSFRQFLLRRPMQYFSALSQLASATRHWGGSRKRVRARNTYGTLSVGTIIERFRSPSVSLVFVYFFIVLRHIYCHKWLFGR